MSVQIVIDVFTDRSIAEKYVEISIIQPTNKLNRKPHLFQFITFEEYLWYGAIHHFDSIA